MVFEVIKAEKNELEAHVESLALAEILRVYLNKDSNVTFAAWKRKHPSEKPILKIETEGKTAKKAMNDAISLIEGDLDKFLTEFKKLK